MAVDANVIIYERIREELRNGMSPQAAIRAGFEKAFSAIAGLERHHADRRPGAVGVRHRPDPRLRHRADAGHRHVDVHLAAWQPRAADADLRRQAQACAACPSADPEATRLEFFHKTTNFPFMATRRVWYALSALLIIASLVLFFTRGLNLAIDFTGGTQVEATFAGAAPIEGIRDGAGIGRLPGAVGAELRQLARRCDPPAAARGPHDRSGAPAGDQRAAGRRRERADQADRIRRSAGRRRAAHQRDLGADPDACAGVHLHRDPLPHLAPVDRCDPRAAARPDPDPRLVRVFADHVRPGGGRGAARRRRLLAQRHHHRVRPHPRALRGQPAPGAGPGAGPVDQPDAVAHHHDQGHHADRGRRAATSGAARCCTASPRR